MEQYAMNTKYQGIISLQQFATCHDSRNGKDYEAIILLPYYAFIYLSKYMLPPVLDPI